MYYKLRNKIHLGSRIRNGVFYARGLFLEISYVKETRGGTRNDDDDGGGQGKCQSRFH